jgi:hypothetical protein
MADASWLITATVGVAAAGFTAWRLHRWLAPTLLARKVADLTVVDDLIEDALEMEPDATTKRITRKIVSDMEERGYAPKLVALVTLEYVEEMRRSRNRRQRSRR